ncbi:LPS export ABC transporter periplasmic protein LptC [uncultured Anaerovibrio sp.]|uniref:LPS export ABC transporter periplasmic protein LptC n=1 Tax=uncultured Anaerovibrio sp. TaxID=361586 RepID=UPI002638E107|nr:LPS export ABC transporter periplasmic protein LptC [uncultured Anaerovibrio sp.]
MNKTGKALVGVTLLLLAALIVWAVNSIPEPPEDSGTGPEQRIVDFDGNTISEERNGKIIWTVTAEDMKMDIDTRDVSLTNVKVTYNFDDGLTLVLKAPQATYTDSTHHLVIVNGVEGESSDGGRFSCKEMEWLSDQDMLAMKGDARIEYDKEQLKVYGDRIESTNGFTKYKAVGNAHLEKGN